LKINKKIKIGEEEKVTGGQIGWVWGMGDKCNVVIGKKMRKFKGNVVVDNEVMV
jgi:hypothetical protein